MCVVNRTFLFYSYVCYNKIFCFCENNEKNSHYHYLFYNFSWCVVLFCVCQASTFSTGVGIELMGPRCLIDCGCTIVSSNETVKEFASSCGTKVPSRTLRQLASLSAHGPKASNRAGCRKVVPIVLDWQWKLDSAAARTISSWMYTVVVVPVKKLVISTFRTGYLLFLPIFV